MLTIAGGILIALFILGAVKVVWGIIEEFATPHE